MDDIQQQSLCQALVENLAAGFEQVVQAYQHRLYGFALRLCGSPRDAEEIAQDAFVRAYRALVGYDDARLRGLKLRPWLFQIALNVYRNRIRRRRVAESPLDDGDEDSAPMRIEGEPRERPDVAFDTSEESRELAAFIAAQPEHLRTAVVLRHVEGLPYDEIAALLGQPVGTVKAHVHRGTRLLRNALAARYSLTEVR
jgi:RNA polymerase sigma-70 factor, ECF subfamily